MVSLEVTRKWAFEDPGVLEGNTVLMAERRLLSTAAALPPLPPPLLLLLLGTMVNVDISAVFVAGFPAVDIVVAVVWVLTPMRV